MKSNYLLGAMLAYSINVNACFAYLAEPEELRAHTPAFQTETATAEKIQEVCTTIEQAPHETNSITITLEINHAQNYNRALWQDLIARTVACSKTFVATDDELIINKTHDDIGELVKFLLKNGLVEQGISGLTTINFKPSVRDPSCA